jgi:beta-carotene 15,15'-dioxygenase
MSALNVCFGCGHCFLKYDYMIAIRQNLWFSLLTMLAIVAYFIIGPFSDSVNGFILIFFLLTTGIPHGAIDHIIYRENAVKAGNGQSLIKGFFLPYLAMMTITVLFWLLLPSFTFWAFLLIAAYHFGQSQLYYFSLSHVPMQKFLLYCLWGIMILSWLWMLHWDAQIPHLQSLFSWNLERGGFLFSLIQYFAVFSPVAFLLFLTCLVYKNTITLKTAGIEVAVALLLITMFYLLPMYVSFGIYFGLWHSTRVILTEYRFLNANAGERISFSAFVKAFIPFSMLSFLGLGLLWLVCYFLKAYITPFMLFLVFISALTIPHAFFMEIMYGWFGKVGTSKKMLSANS